MANFKDELAAKLSAGPNLTQGLRRPVGMKSGFTSPTSPPADQSPSNQGVSIRASFGSSHSCSSRESPEYRETVDSYMDVAMQKINLNRQRCHRIPTKYKTSIKSSTRDTPMLETPFLTSSSLDRIMEEAPVSSVHEETRNSEEKYSDASSSSFARLALRDSLDPSSAFRRRPNFPSISADSEDYDDNDEMPDDGEQITWI